MSRRRIAGLVLILVATAIIYVRYLESTGYLLNEPALPKAFDRMAVMSFMLGLGFLIQSPRSDRPSKVDDDLEERFQKWQSEKLRAMDAEKKAVEAQDSRRPVKTVKVKLGRLPGCFGPGEAHPKIKPYKKGNLWTYTESDIRILQEENRFRQDVLSEQTIKKIIRRMDDGLEVWSHDPIVDLSVWDLRIHRGLNICWICGRLHPVTPFFDAWVVVGLEARICDVCFLHRATRKRRQPKREPDKNRN